MTLTNNTTQILLQYIVSTQEFSVNCRQFVSVIVKNIVKKAYGNHSYTHYEEQQRKEGEAVDGDENDPKNYIDANNLQLL